MVAAKGATSGGSALSAADIRKYAAGAGFTGTVLDNMVGIAFAESGGVPTSHNGKPPDDSYGLWQINMIGKLGPDRRLKFGISNNEELYNPVINAGAAYIIYKSQGLNAWTTYKNGAYLKFTGGKGGTGGAPSPSAADQATNSLSGVYAALNNVGGDIFKGVANLTGIGLAIALLFGGIAILIAQSKRGKQALKDVAGKVI